MIQNEQSPPEINCRQFCRRRGLWKRTWLILKCWNSTRSWKISLWWNSSKMGSMIAFGQPATMTDPSPLPWPNGRKPPLFTTEPLDGEMRKWRSEGDDKAFPHFGRTKQPISPLSVGPSPQLKHLPLRIINTLSSIN